MRPSALLTRLPTLLQAVKMSAATEDAAASSMPGITWL